MSAPFDPSIDLQVSRGAGLYLQINGRPVDDTYGAIVMAELAQMREEFLPYGSTSPTGLRLVRARPSWRA